MAFENPPHSQDIPQTIDLNPGAALERVDSWLDGAVSLFPNIVVAIIIMIIVWFCPCAHGS